MKCPKCGYVSFDYNLTCPKCDRDISSEQEKLHLPSFRYDPPSLLGALTGEANDSRSAGTRGSSEIDLAKEAEISFDEESSHFDSGEVTIPNAGEFELGSEEISLDDTSRMELDSKKGASEDILGSDQDTEQAIADLDLGGVDEEFDLDKGSLDADYSPKKGSLDEDLSLDLESLDLEVEGKGAGQGGTLATGELRLDRESTEDLENLLEMDEISLEEVPLDKKATAPQKPKGKKANPPQDSGELSLDLEDLNLELDLGEGKPQQ